MPDSPARQSARQSLMPCSARTTVLARSLPINRGFASHLGYLEASEHYYHGMQEGCDIPQYAGLPVGSQHTPQNPGPRHGQWPPPGGPGAAPRAWQCHFDMWRNHTTATAAELAALSYDTNAYAQHTISHIKRAAPAERLYVHLMWHAVHAPYTPAPLTETIEPTAAGYYANYCPPPGRQERKREALLQNAMAKMLLFLHRMINQAIFGFKILVYQERLRLGTAAGQQVGSVQYTGSPQTPKQHERCNFGGQKREENLSFFDWKIIQ